MRRLWIALALGVLLATSGCHSGENTAPPGPRALSGAEAEKLAAETTIEFGDAVRNRDLKKFYLHTSEQYQHNMELDRFEETFGPFVDKGVDLSAIDSTMPALNAPPTTYANGVVHVEGTFPAARADFTYEYVFERDRWRIVGFDLRHPDVR